jgi:hypothetical protein
MVYRLVNRYELLACYIHVSIVLMENPAAFQRLIEYPSDLPGCSKIVLGGKQLLYVCSKRNNGASFVVILGFFSGQKEDIITKDLIEPVQENEKMDVEKAIRGSSNAPFSDSRFFFL